MIKAVLPEDLVCNCTTPPTTTPSPPITTPSPPPSDTPTGEPPLTDADFFNLSDDPDDPDNLTLRIGQLANFRGGLRALAGNDTVTGSSSDELINGNIGNDLLLGGSGNDTLRGGRDTDRVEGQDGDDILNGNIGNDIVLGGNGNDIVRGGQDNDLLIGGDGNDTLIGDLGQDLLIGNTGNDVFIFPPAGAVSDPNFADLVIDFNPSDDSIGLTGGVSENDLTFQVINLTVTAQFNTLLLFTDDVTGLTGITPEFLDPNGDGVIEGIAIRNDTNGTFLGVVLGVNASQVSNSFVTVPAEVLAQG